MISILLALLANHYKSYHPLQINKIVIMSYVDNLGVGSSNLSNPSHQALNLAFTQASQTVFANPDNQTNQTPAEAHSFEVGKQSEADEVNEPKNKKQKITREIAKRIMALRLNGQVNYTYNQIKDIIAKEYGVLVSGYTVSRVCHYPSWYIDRPTHLSFNQYKQFQQDNLRVEQMDELEKILAKVGKSLSKRQETQT